MAEKLDQSERASFKELLMVDSIQVDTIAQHLIEKGLFTKLVHAKTEYQENVYV